MKKPIRVGNKLFPTKKSAGDAVRAILYAYPVGATVSDEHAVFLAELLELHPERDMKIGAGIRSFQVERNEGSNGFWLTRTDGTRTDFSFLSCLTPPTPEAEARAGFRSEVRDQIDAFRSAAFAARSMVPCALTGEIVKITNAHIDHDPTFEELLSRFLVSLGVALGAVHVEPTRDGETATRLADRQLAEAWSTFHRVNARLRIVSVRANLSLLRRRA